MMNKKTLFLTLLVAALMPVAFASAANTLPDFAGKVEQTAIDIAISIVVIGWVVAGILYLVAAGEPTKLGIAKKALIACVIGTVLIVLAMGSGAILSVIRDAFGLPAGPT